MSKTKITYWIKEWVYAGYSFFSNTIYALIAAGEPWVKMFNAILLLVPAVLSWYFQPLHKKLILATT